MKKYIVYSAVALILGAGLSACSEDELSSESVITVDQVQPTEFDKWLQANYVNTYNVEVMYRYYDVQSDHNYYTIPADYDSSVKLAHIIKYVCLEAFDEAGGIAFTRANFPKLLYFIGDWEYNNNGTFILGTAEGGKKILMTGVNEIDSHLDNGAELNHFYLKTIFHEFTHIMNQTKDYSAGYKLVTGSGYVAGSWSDPPYNGGGDEANYYLHHGFISSYAQHSDTEDFAEMFSIYVTNTPEQWEAWLTEAETAPSDGKDVDGRGAIESKLSMVKAYMTESWGIDMDELRDIVLRREADIVAGRVNLTDISLQH